MKRYGLIYGCMALFPLMTSCATPSQMALDAEVRRLCAIDGGIKVYETVKLPADKFNEYGQINFYRPIKGENALGSEYIFKEERKYYREGNPEMARWHYVVIRRADNKLLGESTSYWRGGGDMPGPWHDSSFHCPNRANEIQLLMQIFVASKQGNQK